MLEITPEESELGVRLDKWLQIRVPEVSRSKLQSLIKDGKVLASGTIIKNSAYRVKQEMYQIELEGLSKPVEIRPKEIDLDIVYEDEYLMVINKQAGLTVHPGAGNYDNTLVNGLMNYAGENLSSIGGIERPGIVHRLDKDTSGLMLIAKNDQIHSKLSQDLAERLIKRTYNTICWGVPVPGVGIIETNIARSYRNRQKMAVTLTAGKKAITHFKVLETFGENYFSLVECKLETGRTHQIRLHMCHLGHSVVGDQLYGSNVRKYLKLLPDEVREYIENFPRQSLHAVKLEFTHPVTKEELKFKSSFPKDLETMLEMLRSLEVEEGDYLSEDDYYDDDYE